MTSHVFHVDNIPNVIDGKDDRTLYSVAHISSGYAFEIPPVQPISIGSLDMDNWIKRTMQQNSDASSKMIDWVKSVPRVVDQKEVESTVPVVDQKPIVLTLPAADRKEKVELTVTVVD